MRCREPTQPPDAILWAKVLIFQSANPIFYVGSLSKINFASTVFFVPFSDFFADISFRIVCDLQQFRMFPKVFDIFRSNLFPVPESLLAIISGILQTFIKVKFQTESPQEDYSINMQHMQHKIQKNLTKKSRLYAAWSDFSFIQLSKTRLCGP